MTERVRWTKAAFEIACGWLGRTPNEGRFTHMETVHGETWGPFGINRGRGPWGVEWSVTHLPTGCRMVRLYTKAAAKRFVHEIADLTDWATVRACPPEVKDAVHAAYYRGLGPLVAPRPAAPAGAAGGAT